MFSMVVRSSRPAIVRPDQYALELCIGGLARDTRGGCGIIAGFISSIGTHNALRRIREQGLQHIGLDGLAEVSHTVLVGKDLITVPGDDLAAGEALADPC